MCFKTIKEVHLLDRRTLRDFKVKELHFLLCDNLDDISSPD